MVKIADFGISKILDADRSSRTLTSSGGTTGWKAAEVIEAEEYLHNKTKLDVPKITKKTDMFSFGCIFFYVLTKGKHPFRSSSRLYDQNILDEKTEFLTTYTNIRLNCNLKFIETMIAKLPGSRPDAEYILGHPLFWSYEKMLKFIVDISNFVNECYYKHKNVTYTHTKTDTAKAICLDKLEKIEFAKKLNGQPQGWFSAVDIELKKLLLQNSLYKNQYHSIAKLIRLIRNFNNHYNEKTFDQAIKSHVGEIPDFFMKYWLGKFPAIVNEIRRAFDDLKNEPMLRLYY